MLAQMQAAQQAEHTRKMQQLEERAVIQQLEQRAVMAANLQAAASSRCLYPTKVSIYLRALPSSCQHFPHNQAHSYLSTLTPKGVDT